MKKESISIKNRSFLVLILSLVLTTYHTDAQVDVVYNDLVWSDEFDTNGAINSTKWHHQTQLPNGGSWFNGEVQHYTNLITNSFVNNGFLNIVAKKETYTNQGVTKQYTSARLNSKFAFLYGRVDIRAKIPTNQGTWPALWMLGKNVNEDGGFFDAAFGNTGWPACGEIDIMEHVGNTQNKIYGTLHYPNFSGGNAVSKTINISNASTEFHIYSLDWRADAIRFYVDGTLFHTFTNTSSLPFNQNFFLIINCAMGGNFGGAINPNFTSSTFEVDYIRVFN